MARPFFRMPGPAWEPAYDDDESVIYLIDADLRIVRCNPAWDRFATANDGLRAVSSEVIGMPILDAVPAVLQAFYRLAYETVLTAGRDWWHVFECSSPALARFYHMRILPAGDGGLLTINTLVSESPHTSDSEGKVSDYADPHGIVTMCAHCRRVRRIGQEPRWDWMPSLLAGGEVLMSHGLCTFCTAYHYHAR